ncbi:MAG TPA: hypothetical protein VM050_03740 [Patescibacteria group bacterium]|nr:hypothetical protein [Patescibacteria group bacterium]
MSENADERMRKYEDAMKAPLPDTRISGMGTFSIPGLGNGRIAGTGQLSPELVRVSGTGTLPGGISVNRVIGSGSVTFKGDLEGGTIDLSGTARINGKVGFDSLKASGTLTVGGDAKGGSMRVSGTSRIEGGVDLTGNLISNGLLHSNGDVTVGGYTDFEGSIEIGGKLVAGTVEGSLRRERSHVDGGIEADFVDIRKGGRRGVNIILRLLWREERDGDLHTKSLTGRKSVYIENVYCESVSGGDVTIGEGCRVGRVRYTGKVTVHPEAEVESPPEKVGSLTD